MAIGSARTQIDNLLSLATGFVCFVRSSARAIKLDGNMPGYYCELAQVYLTEGYTRQAIEQLQRAKELAPGSIEVALALALGNAYLAAEHYSAAIREFRELLDQVPDQLPARKQLATALRTEGRVEDAAQEPGLSAPRQSA